MNSNPPGEKGVIRLGILSTARISNGAVLKPAQHLKNIEIVAIGSRNLRTAKRFARKHHIRKYYGSYEALLKDPEIDAIYNPLPNSMHKEWSIKALHAGKHVLCEKPFASNEQEAIEMKQAALESHRLLIEAFHIRYHPLLNQIKVELDAGTIGSIEKIYTKFCINLNKRKSNIRLEGDLAGGGVMDVGCYCISALRMLIGSEPEVTGANAKTEYKDPRIDTFLHGDLSFSQFIPKTLEKKPDDTQVVVSSSNPIQASLDCSLFTSDGGSQLIVDGSLGRLVCEHPFSSTGDVFTCSLKNGKVLKFDAKTPHFQTTYYFQLDSFVKHILASNFSNASIPTNVDDAIGNMKVIDALYSRAGLSPRMHYD